MSARHVSTRRARVGAAHLVLPPTWWTVPLVDAEATGRSVRALVHRQCSGLDDQPLLRRDLTRRLSDQADRAASSGGRVLALQLLTVEAVPVPSALVVHWLPAPAGEGHPLAALHRTLGPGAAVDGDVDLAPLPCGPALRWVRERDAALEGAPPQRAVLADYWVTSPDRGSVLQLVFSTPLAALREPMLELFDAITGSATWDGLSAPAPTSRRAGAA